MKSTGNRAFLCEKSRLFARGVKHTFFLAKTPPRIYKTIDKFTVL